LAARKPADYIAGAGEAGFTAATRTPLSPREAAEERLLTGLRITEGVPLAEVAALAIAPATVANLVEVGLLADDPERLRATPSGRLVLDRLTAELAA
jgi:oxygen-independent coproporphyrinogen-3 oxidase